MSPLSNHLAPLVKLRSKKIGKNEKRQTKTNKHGKKPSKKPNKHGGKTNRPLPLSPKKVPQRTSADPLTRGAFEPKPGRRSKDQSTERGHIVVWLVLVLVLVVVVAVAVALAAVVVVAIVFTNRNTKIHQKSSRSTNKIHHRSTKKHHKSLENKFLYT